MFTDTELIVRDPSTAGDLNEDETSDAIHLGRMKEPVYLALRVPEGGAAMTLDVSVQIDTGSYVDYIKYPQITTEPDNDIFIPILLPAGYEDVKIKFDVGGTSPDFGEVMAGIVLKPRYNL